MHHVYEIYMRNSSRILVNDLLKTLTTFNRIQGSKGLWDAVSFLKEMVEDRGFETKLLTIESGVKKGYIETPVSWDLIDAYVEFRDGDNVIGIFSSRDHPTIVAAHAPSGEGCGELSICSNDKCSDSVVLATGYPYDLYVNNDANLFVYYNENRYPDAFPYTGLFLEPNEIMRNKTMVTIPYRFAQKLISLVKVRNRKINVCWKIESSYGNRGLPALLAWRGEEPGILFISHICHPKPGAHDNVSGSVANFIALDVLSRVGSEESFGSIHVWVPEYTGTVFLRDHLPWIPKSILNLDMVGSKQNVSGSTLVVINTPRFIASELASYLWFSIQKVFDSSFSYNGINQPSIRYSYSPYGIGSDHDVFVTWGYDAIMINEWPSKFYHTDMDDVDSIDPMNIIKISVSSLLASFMLIKKPNKNVKEIFESFVRVWYRSQALRNDFSLSFLVKNMVKTPVITEPFEKPILETPVFGRAIYRILGRDAFLELDKIRNALTYLEVYGPLAEAVGLKNHIKSFQAELLVKWSRKEEDKVKDAFAIIKSRIGL